MMGRGMGPGMGQGMRPGMGQRGQNLSEADRNAFFEARLAAMKAGLMLTEAQQRLWPAVETAMRDLRKQRMDFAERIRKEGQPANHVDRMKRAGEMMSARGAAMTKFADAMKPFHDSLTDEQKRRMQMMRGGMRNGMASGMGPRGGMRGEFQQRWQQHHGWQGRGGDFGRGNHGPGWRQGTMEPRDDRPGEGRRFDRDDRGGNEGRGWGRRWQQDAPDYSFGSQGNAGDWRRM
jgi:hypothetical protein